MAQSLRGSRFRRRGDIGEDVNPSAYIVNLADCMLVLACGFMVALISFWNIDAFQAQELDNEQLSEVDPETLPEEISEGGSYYIEAGKVYQDPNTGQLYMVQEDDEASTSDSSTSSTNTGSSNASSTSSNASTQANDSDIAKARAAGGD